MTKVRHSLKRTQSETIAKVVSAESCHIVLETSPPEYVDKISRYLRSSAGQNGQCEVSIPAAEAESDSGESLFITQKPVPEPQRSERPRRSIHRSHRTSTREIQPSQDEDSSSSSDEDKVEKKKKKKKKYRLPKYSFSFLNHKRWKRRTSELSAPQNISLHMFAMGGFFKCTRDMWESTKRGDDLWTSLPTADGDGEDISPISEEEEALEDGLDIKMLERKHFVVPSKAKRSRCWFTLNEREQQQEQRRRTEHEASQGGRWKTTPKIPTATSSSVSRLTLCSDTESSDDGVLGEKETSGRSIQAQTETPKRRGTRGVKKIIFQQKEKEDELCDDSDATFCEISPKDFIQEDRGASTTVTESQADVFHSVDLSHSGQGEGEPEGPDLTQSDSNNEKVCSEDEMKKEKMDKGGHEGVEEEEEKQNQEELEGPRAAVSENEGIMEVEETPGVMEESDVPHSKQKKKKKKKNKSTAEDVRQEVDGGSEVRVEEDSVLVSCTMENGGEEKKKKRKRKRNDDDEEDAEQVKSNAAAETLSDDAEIQKKKKKKRKKESNMCSEQVEEMGDCSENTQESQETAASSHVKRKKHKKKQQREDDAQVGEEGCVDVSFSGGVTTVAGSAGMLVKKKKKKKNISESVDTSHAPEEDDTQKATEGAEDPDVELVTKKKKKKKKKEESEISSISGDTVAQSDDSVSVQKKKKKKSEISSISGDTVAQSDDSVSVQKKEKKKSSSFLVADAGEKRPQSVDVWSGGKSEVSCGDSAEVTGSLEEANDDGVRKKKKKKKNRRPEKDHEPDCEARQAAPSETGVERKKKQKRNESESTVERSDSAADAGCSDEAAVLKKKKKKRKDTEEMPSAATGDTGSEKVNSSESQNGLTVVTLPEYVSSSPGNQTLNVREKKKKKKNKICRELFS